MKVNISNRSETQKILKKYGLTLKKSLGQNFLIDPNILDKIVEKSEIDLETGVIEIGPGIGALTEKIADFAGKVVAIEIDKRLIPILEETLSPLDNVEIINQDVLKISLMDVIQEKLKDYKKIKVVANLPYYITTPILIKLLEEKLPLDSITIMVQKEVAERISATPGRKEYGSLTVMVNYYADARIAFHVPSAVFIPKPNVDSSILHLTIKKEQPFSVEDEELFFRVLRASFAHRRKTLYNNLIVLLGKENKDLLIEILNKKGIEPNRRAETLTLEDFVDLSNIIQKNFKI